MADGAVIAVDVVGPDDHRVVDDWTVEVRSPSGSTKVATPGDRRLRLDEPGKHVLTLTSIAPTHVGPEGRHAKKAVTVVDGDPLTASHRDQPTDEDTPVTWHVSAAQETTAAGPLISVSAALIAIVAVAFWTFVITLDEEREGLGWPIIAVMVGVAVVLLALSAWFYRAGNGYASVALALGIVLLIAAVGLAGRIALSPEQQFAIATGGLAIAAFVIGLLRFDTVKAAASLPIVVLFIGLAVFPSGAAGMDEDVQQTLIIAMGGILGISAVGEAVQQATNNVANGRVRAAQISAAAAAGAPVEALGKRPVPTASGDLTRRA